MQLFSRELPMAVNWLLSTTVFASFLGGVVALLAPCCVSVMLPAYFASTYRQRSRILGMTLVFAAGVGVVILPIALGASVPSRFILGEHRLVFSVGGGLMVLAGVAMLAGWSFMLPMPARRGSGRGIGGAPRWSGGVQDALAQQVELGPAVHPPLDHFDAVDVALHGA